MADEWSSGIKATCTILSYHKLFLLPNFWLLTRRCLHFSPTFSEDEPASYLKLNADGKRMATYCRILCSHGRLKKNSNHPAIGDTWDGAWAAPQLAAFTASATEFLFPLLCESGIWHLRSWALLLARKVLSEKRRVSCSFQDLRAHKDSGLGPVKMACPLFTLA